MTNNDVLTAASGLSRRRFLSLLGGSVAGVAAIGTAGKALAAHRNGPAHGSAADTTAAWVVAAIHPVSKGALPIDLRNSVTGEVLRVEVCKAGSGLSSRAPVAKAGDYDLFLVNGGTGRTPTQREHVLATRALGRRIRNELRVAPQQLLTLDERLDAHRDLFDTNDDPVYRA